ncbi:hypothetical protein CEY15_17695 [Dietzia natronolimnaea]|uniref:Cardiolipin synthase N-terminal domain-containing protein n=1 Tax=Dietzia natronolimnaea TaxID=161920 RepID=A0A2A2WKF6_9ACTN|nr:PLDc N-terminal domain-containing protein [Dietzia natronolimnaea]PAY21680.1 hypothetical protein CEY15_17695 [Dietzia natronolimnaea]
MPVLPLATTTLPQDASQVTFPAAYDIAWSAAMVGMIVLDVLALIHLARHRRTTYDWAWALVILALPLLGVLLYALLGPRRRSSDNTVRDTITSPR